MRNVRAFTWLFTIVVEKWDEVRTGARNQAGSRGRKVRNAERARRFRAARELGFTLCLPVFPVVNGFLGKIEKAVILVML